MPAQKKSAAPSDKLEQFEKLLASFPEVERKGATHSYTSVNGNMFSCLHPPGVLSLRLPEGVRGQFLKKYDATLFQAYGIVQKEYVAVPDALLKNTRALRPYFEQSYRYALTLKPKPSKRKG
jgi:hypothetical protein